jgi:hypothetical protein
MKIDMVVLGSNAQKWAREHWFESPMLTHQYEEVTAWLAIFVNRLMDSLFVFCALLNGRWCDLFNRHKFLLCLRLCSAQDGGCALLF